MNALRTPGHIVDDPAGADASHTLAKLVIKLRWMGMEEEARRVQTIQQQHRQIQREETMKMSTLSATAFVAMALLSIVSSDRASAQPAAPKLSGTYRCEPEPTSCQWSGQTFTVGQTGTKLDMKSDKGDVAQGLLSSNVTLSVGAPWNMLGVIEPDNSIQWSNGTVWRKQAAP
jgi:hypothetical protein